MNKPMTIREAARNRVPLSGPDAQALEGGLSQCERELAELKRWAETPPPGYERFMQIWGACVRLVEKASFKVMFNYAEELEQKLKETRSALEESVKLQSHYAELLNMHDGGKRRVFTADEWIARLKKDWA